MPRLIPDMLLEHDFPVEFGRYTLLGVLGEGAMARVYRAELRGPGGFAKPTAVKIVRGAIAGRGAELREALLNEARLGGMLDHPNLVQTLDYGVVDGLPFMAMGYVRGIGLDRLLASDQDVPPEVALEIALQLCAGLDHAHNLGGTGHELVHRDLKPSNIILDRHGQARILDFGIAKAAALSADTTAVGSTKGTPAYMSPEQANGESLDRRSDIFSMGTLIFELVTRERLFASTSPLATLQAVLRVEERLTDPEFEARLDRIVPGLGPVVSRCLREAPRLRYDDCAMLQDALQDVATGFTPAPRMRDWVRETHAAMGLDIDDPAGLSRETPIPVAISFGPDGRPRSLDRPIEPGVDDVVTDRPMPAVELPPEPTPVLETRPMQAVVLEPQKKTRGWSGLALAALGILLLVVIGLGLWRESQTGAVGGSSGPLASAPVIDGDVGDLADPIDVPEQATPHDVGAPNAPTAPRNLGSKTRGAATRPPPARDPTPDEGPPPLQVDVQQAAREAGKAKVMVTARIDAPAEAKLVVHFKPPIGAWQKAPLKSMGPGGWFRMLDLPMPPGSVLRWYVTAEFDHGGRTARIREGTKTGPKKFTLPRG